MPYLNGNWIDLLIILVLVLFLIYAWQKGLLISLGGFLSMSSALFFSFYAFKPVSVFIQNNFNLKPAMSNAFSFLIVALMVEIILSYFLYLLVFKLPERPFKTRAAKMISLLPGIGEALIITSFILMFLTIFPLFPRLNQSITRSRIGGALFNITSPLKPRFNEAFGGVIDSSFVFLTIRPESNETIKLNAPLDGLEKNDEAKRQMFELINLERRGLKLDPLSEDQSLNLVAQRYAKDMWDRQYFSHYSPEGMAVSDRLKSAQVTYRLAGENLALAPSVKIAHQGLMNSQGHRDNILDASFSRIGISAYDNGIYGTIFVQVFTD